ncbi:MAG: hypothetical protein RBQ87_01305 [Candidatus Cloacimonadaceae bacterium]|jgi:hypothetical protein|nr:hypothetical protein [Candidatus Cloacimonadaceae bacterium]
MILDKMILDGYVFPLNPSTMPIPESKKLVSEVKTYSGSAIFQWPEVIQGQDVDLTWTYMSAAQYEQLRTIYLKDQVVTFDPKYLGTYGVIVKNLTGKYHDGAFHQVPFRIDVEMKLNIRSFTADAP